MKKMLSVIMVVLVCLSSVIGQTKDTKFEVKGFYLDCRAQVLTVDAIMDLIDDLSSKGLNTLLFEWEATFPFEEHSTLSNEFVFSKQEVKDIIAYATKKGIDVIPLQNCFGHAEYILRHGRYNDLREDKKEVSMICPLKHELAAPIFKEIFEEVAALHPSKYFHIGADETFLLGKCEECQKIVAKEGKSRLFVDYINSMVKLVQDMGKTPVIWADVILKYPEAVDQLSKDLIFVDWNYGWDVNRFGDLQHLFDAGVKMWGASALRSGPDNMYITMWKKHFYNLTTFLPHARKNGYQGLINTSWSTSGGYGFHYDSYNEVMFMQPIRQVYPTQAFNILLEAYKQAVHFEEPLDEKKFILDYAVSRFGVDKSEAHKLLNYMMLPQETIRRTGKDSRGVLIADAIAETEKVVEEFRTFRPKENKWEYDHLVLMLDIRLNYMCYKEIECQYDSYKFTADKMKDKIKKMSDRMQDIAQEANVLHERFIKLNTGYLKEGQWQSLKDAHDEKLQELARRLKTYSENL